MKSIIISSNASGGGKTTVTLGIMKALSNRGFQVQGYKTGPDYIDSAFHSHILGKSSRNLDTFLMSEEGVKASYSRGTGELGVIEGVMGLYDGIGIDTEGSTAHLSKLLDVPVVLVITPKAQSVTLCAEINGLIDFENVNIAGVILNNISEGYYKILKLLIETHCRTKVFGYLPNNKELSIESRHLGLVQSSEIEDLDKKIQICAELLENHVDIDMMLEHFKETKKYEDNFHIKRGQLNIAVALDKAFSFYYKENLEMLEEAGNVTYFSPLKDKSLPDNIDFLYLGGGYPEVFIDELSSNKTMMQSIKNALDKGLHCYAECGGLMYLTESINGKQTVGFFKGKAVMSDELQNFGYAEIEVEKDNPLIKKGSKIRCHEFHKSYVELNEETIYKITKKNYDNSHENWKCGYLKNNTIGTYAHVHFFDIMRLSSILKY
ncbi:MAG: cobyrinate a,c-diamide synthase [Bacillota bacterium]|nr:cobyrinate a,c-diamide synthase [Bacillota bacterium]